jgi:hypothetical protein
MADSNTTNFGLVQPEVGASLDTWGAKLNDNFADLDALALGFYTVGGTANARTITTGLALTTIPTGFRVRFIAPAVNTGATTLEVDGAGPIACQTITGVALPNGYIRTGVVTEAYYNGTNWIVDRLPERGSNANGEWTRSAEGLQTCTHTLTSSASGGVIWTFPQPFVNSAAKAFGSPKQSSFNLSPAFSSTTATQVEFSSFNTANGRVANTTDLFAIGRWY